MSLSTSTTVAEASLFYSLKQVYVIYMLSFIGGYVDAIGYINLHGLFTSSITGNLVVAAVNIVTQDDMGVLLRVLTTLLFFMGGFVSTFIALKLKLCHDYNKHQVALHLLLFQLCTYTVALICSVSLDLTNHGFNTSSDVSTIMIGELNYELCIASKLAVSTTTLIAAVVSQV